MATFMVWHTLPKGSVSRQQAEQVAQALQRSPKVKGRQSFLNLAEGKITCIVEAQRREDVQAAYKELKLPYDMICQVELEGEAGAIHEATRHAAHA